MEQITVFNRKSAEKIRMKVSIVIFREDNRVIYYSPSLDLSGYGKTESVARKSFEISLKETVNYCIENGTFRPMLESLGWIRTPGANTVYKAPSIASKINTNEYLQNVINNNPEVVLKNDFELSFV